MKQRRRGIDMLPLLDVFMVVLFVFATIQETQLDVSTQSLDEAQAELAAAVAELAERRRSERALERELAGAEKAREDKRELAKTLADYERACGPQVPGGPLCPAATADPADAVEQARMAALHERMLDNVPVFEVELQGRADPETGQLDNLCCFRADPPTGEWKRCGEIPSDLQRREEWLDDGGEGLIDGLRRTRGGDALVLLRQGGQARYRLSNDFAEQLREQLPDHRIYDDGRVESLGCPLFDAPPDPTDPTDPGDGDPPEDR